jgi:outer membrane murein-binding lipoprotein Lpp
MCIPVAAAVIGSAIIGGGVALHQGAKNRKVATAAQQSNERQAQQQAQRAEEQFNRANQKMPGIAGLWDSNRRAASKGLGSTFLTGTKGVPQLPLGGGASLLGG